MGRRRLGVLIALVAAGGSVLLVRLVGPGRYDSLVADANRFAGDVPDPVVLAAVVLAILAVWIAAMILLGKALYWGWRQVDDYVFRAWDLVLPESPLIRFAVGLLVMLFLFVFGPLVVLQAVDFFDEEDQEVIDANETTPDDGTTNETTPDDGTTPGGTTNETTPGGTTNGSAASIPTPVGTPGPSSTGAGQYPPPPAAAAPAAAAPPLPV